MYFLIFFRSLFKEYMKNSYKNSFFRSITLIFCFVLIFDLFLISAYPCPHLPPFPSPTVIQPIAQLRQPYIVTITSTVALPANRLGTITSTVALPANVLGKLLIFLLLTLRLLIYSGQIPN